MIKNNDDLTVCKSCGEKKDETLKICFYCFHRGNVGTVKMLLLMVLEENGKLMFIDDILNALNEHVINNGKKNFKYHTIMQKLKYLSNEDDSKGENTNYNLVKCVQVKKKGKVGRPRNKYKITAKGKKFLKSYLELWDDGYVPMKAYKTKKGKYLEENSVEVERKARKIRSRIEAELYERFEFIFP